MRRLIWANKNWRPMLSSITIKSTNDQQNMKFTLSHWKYLQKIGIQIIRLRMNHPFIPREGSTWVHDSRRHHRYAVVRVWSDFPPRQCPGYISRCSSKTQIMHSPPKDHIQLMKKKNWINRFIQKLGKLKESQLITAMRIKRPANRIFVDIFEPSSW